MKIIEKYIARLTKSICIKTGKEYFTDNFRNFKYKQKDGVLLITQDASETRFKWHPLLQKEDSGEIEVDALKGIASSPIIKKTLKSHSQLIIETVYSIYYFSIEVTQDVDEILNNMVIKIYM